MKVNLATKKYKVKNNYPSRDLHLYFKCCKNKTDQ